jgi:hypothetical protein
VSAWTGCWSLVRRTCGAYAAYYNEVRTHLALGKDAPLGRAVQRSGAIVAIPILSGLPPPLRTDIIFGKDRSVFRWCPKSARDYGMYSIAAAKTKMPRKVSTMMTAITSSRPKGG